MAETFKDVLKHIQSFLESDEIFSEEKRRLWDVLSALRGPDSEDSTLKNSTTAVIRWHALGNSVRYVGAITGFDDDDYATERVKEERKHRRYVGNMATDGNMATKRVYDHFHDHTINAFKALGLDYYNNNDK